MKRPKIIIPVILFCAGFLFHAASAQTGPKLSITAISGFPTLPTDSAFEGQQYTVTVEVKNLDSNQFAGADSLFITWRNDTATIQQENIASLFIDSLVGYDSLSITIQSYFFTPSHYKSGSNIVVVWPRLQNGINSTYDSLTLNVFFVPFTSVSMLHAENGLFSIYPNPVSKEISLIAANKNTIEYVRILNDIGQEVLLIRTNAKQLDVGFLSEGFYFVEIRERNGTVARKKFLKL